MSKTPFVDALVQESLPIWQQCLDSDFLRGLEAGTLDEDCFKGYIVDDSLYLREYARVFAWGMTKAQTMAAMRNYYSLLSFVNENEDVARLQYLKRYGLTDDDIQSLPQRPANRAYTDYMIEATKNGEGEAECIAAVLHAELFLDFPAASEALARCAGYGVWSAGEGLRLRRLRRRLPSLG